jgi:NuA3 HAT complex component NTO1
MAPSSSPKYRSSPEALKNSSKTPLQDSVNHEPAVVEELPLKNLKYVPGRPGGGGRYIGVAVREIVKPKPKPQPRPKQPKLSLVERRNSSMSCTR